MKLYSIIPGQVYQRGRFAHFSKEWKLRVLKTHNIGMVVCLIKRTDQDLVTSNGVEYLHCPIADSAHADFNTFEDAVAKAVGYIRCSGEAVLVHCNAGRNRSSLFSARLLMELEGVSGAQAVERLQTLRPGALATVAFTDYLRRLK